VTTISAIDATFRRGLIFVSSVIGMLMSAAASFAQTATPVPTAIPITINTNALLTQINTWTSSLDDIIFIGIAIGIAIALLGFIGKQILRAFQGAS